MTDRSVTAPSPSEQQPFTGGSAERPPSGRDPGRPIVVGSSGERRQLYLVLLAALIIPMILLGRVEYETLEGDVLSIALRPVIDILRDNYPDQSPLFFILEHFWTMVFGVQEFATRMQSVLISVVGVFFCYRFGRQMFGHRVGLIGAALLIVTPGFYDHARFARMYALLLTAGVASAFFAARYVDERRPKDLGWWVLASLIAIYTHFFGFGTTGLTGAYMVLMTLKLAPKRLPGLLAACAVIGAAAGWQVLRMKAAMGLASGKGQTYRMRAVFPDFFSSVNHELFFKGFGFGGIPGFRYVDLLLLAFFMGLVVYGLTVAARRYALLGGLYLFLSQATLFVVAMKADVRPRYFAFLMPVYLPFIAAALDRLLGGRAAPGLGAAWPAAPEADVNAGVAARPAGDTGAATDGTPGNGAEGGTAASSSAASSRLALGGVATWLMILLFLGAIVAQNVRKPVGYVQAMTYVQSIYQPGDLLAAHPRWHHPIVQLRSPVPVLAAADWTVLTANAPGHKRVILILLGVESSPPRMLAWLNSHGTLTETRTFNSVKVMTYTLESDVSPALRQLQARFQAVQPGELSLLLGGTVGPGAQPVTNISHLEAALHRPDPFVASLDAGGARTQPLQAAARVGVDYLAAPGTTDTPRVSEAGLEAIPWPAPPALVGEPMLTSSQPAAVLLPIDLSGLEGAAAREAASTGLPAAVSGAIQAARGKGPLPRPVVALVRWPRALGGGASEPAKALANRIAEAGAAAVLGVSTSEIGPVWRHSGALVAPWPGMLLRAPRRNVKANTPPDGLLMHLRIDAKGQVDGAALPVSSTAVGLEPAGLTLPSWEVDETPENAVVYDFRKALPEVEVKFPANEELKAAPDAMLPGSRMTPVIRWGASDLKTVGWGAERSDATLREGIWAPLPGGRELELTFPAAVMGDELRGFLGLPDESFNGGKRKSLMGIEVQVDGKSVGSTKGAGEPGWKHFRFDTRAWAGKKAAVTFLLHGDNGLPLLFDARNVTVPPAGPIPAGSTPASMVDPRTVAMLETVAKAEAADASSARDRAESGEAGSGKSSNAADGSEAKGGKGSSAGKRAGDNAADGGEGPEHGAGPDEPDGSSAGGGDEAPAMSTKGTEVDFGGLHYRLPKDVPTMGGAGVLADPRWKAARSADQAPPAPLPPTPPGVYRLRDHLHDAVVTFTPYEGGQEVCSSWTDNAFYLKGEEYGPDGEGQLRGRWRCGTDAWKTVAQTRQKSGGELRDALWIHPRDNGVVQVTFPQVPLTGKLEGYFGLTDLASGKNDFAAYMEVLVGGRLVMRKTIEGGSKGWTPFTIDTSIWQGRKVDVAIRVETDKQRWRHFCLDAMAQ